MFPKQADRLVARQLLVGVYEGLKGAERAVPRLEEALLSILQSSTQHEPTFSATMLELSLTTRSRSLISSSLIADGSQPFCHSNNGINTFVGKVN